MRRCDEVLTFQHVCARCLVILQAFKEAPPVTRKCKDKFLVQSTVITANKETMSVENLVRDYYHFATLVLKSVRSGQTMTRVMRAKFFSKNFVSHISQLGFNDLDGTKTHRFE